MEKLSYGVRTLIVTALSIFLGGCITLMMSGRNDFETAIGRFNLAIFFIFASLLVFSALLTVFAFMYDSKLHQNKATSLMLGVVTIPAIAFSGNFFQDMRFLLLLFNPFTVYFSSRYLLKKTRGDLHETPIPGNENHGAE